MASSESSSSSYPKTSVNKLGRLPNRGHYDHVTINTIINTAPILHVSFNDPEHPFPVVLPMLGRTGDFPAFEKRRDKAVTEGKGEDDEEVWKEDVEGKKDIYIHGWVSGRLFRMGKNAAGEGDGQEEEGLPVTVAASILDALILSLTPFHNSCNYRSALAYGHARPVTSPQEKLYAMRLITDSLLPGRWSASRVPPTKTEMDSTSILKVSIVSASAKVRVGGPSEDRKDLKDEALRGRVWTGAVPVWLQWGEPVPAETNGREGVERYIEGWRVGENATGKGYAYEAIEMTGGK